MNTVDHKPRERHGGPSVPVSSGLAGDSSSHAASSEADLIGDPTVMQRLARVVKKPVGFIAPIVSRFSQPAAGSRTDPPASVNEEASSGASGSREWKVIYRKPPSLLDRCRGRDREMEEIHSNTETQIDRLEMKYLVHPRLVADVRKFIAPFVVPDKHAKGDLPSYTATTLQIDSINSTLHYAKQRDADARFKLRIRTYGFDGTAPYFFELKRKIQGKIYKSRAVVSARDYCKEMVVNPTRMLSLKDPSEQMNLLEFIRLVKVIGGIPAVYVRYERECYAGIGKEYARVTFDSGMRYRPAMNSWDFPLNEKKWYAMDSATSQARDYSGYMLELKSTSEVPDWMLECVERFNLVPAGHCKFSMAMNLEAIYRGHSFSDTSEDTTPFENAAD